MQRFRTFLLAYLSSYVLVTVVGVLLQLRPWEPDTSNWVSQHPQIYIFDFFVFQIPGLAIVPFLFGTSPLPELVFLIFAIMLTIRTWKNWRLPERTDLLRKLGLYSYCLASTAVFCRLILPIMLPYAETEVDRPFDIRNPVLTWTWISFQSTLMLTLVIVHLTLRFSSLATVRATR